MSFLQSPAGILSGIPSSLTERLGWCALHFLWQGAAAGAALWLLLILCRRGTAELRHGLCGLTLLLMAALPVITWQQLPPPQSVKPRTVQLPEAVVLESGGWGDTEALRDQEPGWMGDRRAVPGNNMAFLEEEESRGAVEKPEAARGNATPWWQRGLGVLWLAGTVLMGLWRLWALGSTWHVVRCAERAGMAVRAQVEGLARHCGMRRIPLVRITERLVSPAVAGILRPVVLLPASALTGLSPRELEFVLVHELAHIRRQDFVLGLLQALVETLLFFHPVMWWVSRRMSFEREQACDDEAMRLTGNAPAGARALARLAELQLQHSTALAPAAAGGQILARIRRLLEPGRVPHPAGMQGVVLMPALLMAAAVALVLLTQKAGSQMVEIPPAPVPVRKDNSQSGTAPGLADSSGGPAAFFKEPGEEDGSLARAEGMPVPAVRGAITDREGVVLAESVLLSTADPASSRGMERRIYPLGATASHVLGHVQLSGPVNAAPEARPGQKPAAATKEKERTAAVFSGVAGLEKGLDAQLRARPSQGGRSMPAVALTLDARVQRICENALREARIGRGAAVVLDVSNGEILAMASVPDFDPNGRILLGPAQTGKELQDDPTEPLSNRALTAFPPGSTFKLVTAMAAGSGGLWNKNRICPGSVTYGGRSFLCWTGARRLPPHGPAGLEDALKWSCNCWFYQCGNDVGIDRIEQMAKGFGMGARAEIGLDYQVSGFMPGREWWAARDLGPWTSAKTANISIGQGEVQATPLQMAGVAAAVANGGKVWRPRLTGKTLAGEVWQAPAPVLGHDLVAEGMEPAALAAIRAGMWKSVHEGDGTGKRANGSIVAIAGKTGTAQKFRYESGTGSRDGKGRPARPKQIPDNHAWFVGFAPYGKPRYAFAVVVGNAGAGGAVSAPIARRIMEAVALRDQGRLTVDLSPLAPMKGHFDYVEEVNYPEPLPGQ